MLIPRFLSVGSTTVTVRRTNTGSYNTDGRWVEPTYTEFTITANVQPHLVKRRDKEGKVGDSSQEAIKLYTTTPLSMTQEGSLLKKGDKVLWNGVQHDVKEEYTYTMGVLNHTKAVCIREELV